LSMALIFAAVFVPWSVFFALHTPPENTLTKIVPTDGLILRGLVPWTDVLRETSINRMFYLPLALLFLSPILAGKRALPWLVAALFFTLFSLGAYYRYSADDRSIVTSFRLPFYWLYSYVPLLDRWKFPSRAFALALISCGVASGFAIRRLTAWKHLLPRILIGLALCGIALVEAGSYFRTNIVCAATPRVDPFYSRLARETPRRALIDVPFNFGQIDAWYQYYQTVHGAPMLNGIWPAYFPLPASARLLNTNSVLYRINVLQQPLNPYRVSGPSRLQPALETDENLPRDVQRLRELGFGYVIVHRDLAADTGAPLEALLSFLTDVFGPPVLQSNQIVVFLISVDSGLVVPP